MFNPCYAFTPALLESMLAKHILFFVRSAYTRGRELNGEIVAEAFMISHYNNKMEAERHYNTIAYDKYRFLYDPQNPGHVELPKKAAKTKEYKIFSRLIAPGADKKATRLYA